MTASLDLTESGCPIDDFLDQLPVADVWGIGRRYSELLGNNNIKTARELRDCNDAWVREHMTVVGLRTVWELRGIQCLSLELAPPPKQSLICSRSFGRPVVSLMDLKEAIATHISNASVKLRKQQSIAQSLQVFIETNRFKTDFYSNSITFQLDQPTAYTPELTRVAIAGLERIYQSGFIYKRAGIMLLGICPQDQVQAGFWGREYSKRDKKVMEVVDEINKRFGRGTIKIAASCLTKEQLWQMKCDRRSPRYTTRWDELPIVKAGDIAGDMAKRLSTSTVSLFWKDAASCCFTTLRYFTHEDHAERARRMAATIEEFSSLELYCVINNDQILPWQPARPAPPSGTERRFELALNPSEPLNPWAGITTISVTVPGPCRAATETFTAKPANFQHLFWQLLDTEVIPWLRLPNGLPVSATAGDGRIKYGRLFEIPEEYRPQPGRPPVDAAISSTMRKLDQARSVLARAQRANQPLELALASFEKQQRHLEFLQLLHDLEQRFWQQLQNQNSAPEDQTELLPSIELTPITDRIRYLPNYSQSILSEWFDLAPADFENPNLWAPLGELKSRFKITSERTFWRTIAQLKTKGLRTLPSRQDQRIRLFYRPEIDRLLAQPTTLFLENVRSANSTNITNSTLTPNFNDQIWQAITELQKQHQVLLQALNISLPNNSLHPQSENLAVVPFRQSRKKRP